MFSVQKLSFTAMGTPSSSPREAPDAARSSASLLQLVPARRERWGVHSARGGGGGVVGERLERGGGRKVQSVLAVCAVVKAAALGTRGVWRGQVSMYYAHPPPNHTTTTTTTTTQLVTTYAAAARSASSATEMYALVPAEALILFRYAATTPAEVADPHPRWAAAARNMAIIEI